MAPLTKPVPAMTMLWFAAPCPRDDGLAEATVGAESGVVDAGSLVSVQLRQTAVTV